MTYNPAIPQSGDRPSQSQPQLLSNFADLKTFLDKNHVALVNPGSDSGGLHKFLQMPEQVAAPSTAVSEGALYTKDDGTRTALFWRQENNGTEVQLTGPDPSLATQGFTFIAGGLLLQWGTRTAFNSGATLTWPTPFGTFYAATLSRRETSDQRGFVQFDSVSGPNATGAVVRVRDSSGTQINNQTIYFIAIGTQP